MIRSCPEELATLSSSVHQLDAPRAEKLLASLGAIRAALLAGET